jgi:hypothetical protein
MDWLTWIMVLKICVLMLWGALMWGLARAL